jgi:hypothetical protein
MFCFNRISWDGFIFVLGFFFIFGAIVKQNSYYSATASGEVVPILGRQSHKVCHFPSRALTLKGNPSRMTHFMGKSYFGSGTPLAMAEQYKNHYYGRNR